MDSVIDNQTPVSTKESASLEEVRNWLELPQDVLSVIFLKLGATDILFRAQSVCSLWWNFSKEPLLFRSIDMRKMSDLLDGNMYDTKKMAREAVDRSCGQLVEFTMDVFGSNELLAYIAEKSGELRCLRLVSVHQVNSDSLINMAKKAVMLEELEISHCSLSEDKHHMIIAVGNACPQLKSFWLNCPGYRRPHIECDDEALAISENMPELRHLHLFGNKLTNVGLRCILDGCLHLESLDLRRCFNLNIGLEGDHLLKTCRDRCIKLRLPNDSTADHEFDDGSDDFSSRSYNSYLDGGNEFDYHSDFDSRDESDYYRGFDLNHFINGSDSDSDIGYHYYD